MEQIKNKNHQQLPIEQLNEISPKEKTQEGMKFVNLINDIYILFKQKGKILNEVN